MTPERWARIEEIYQGALEQEESARSAFVQQACIADEELRQEVESLLAQSNGSFLDQPAAQIAAGVAKLLDKEQAPSPLLAGQELGSFHVLEKIGEGGMGVVYRAHDAKLGRDVALKILPEAMAHDLRRMARFEREARTLAALNHPHIAAIHGLEEAHGLRALVMELVEGETLEECLRGPQGAKRKVLSLEEALPIARQIAEALEYAHEHGIIHRDLKPANVKITPEGAVKVLDFGLAKVMRDEDSTAPVDPDDSPELNTKATQPGMILGTAAYMSPEQARGKQVDRRTDIWAFGCVLYEMLTGWEVFAGESMSDVLAAVIKSEPDWSALPETVPPSIQKLLHRCMQKDTRQRLQAIGEARIAIEEVLSGGRSDVEAKIWGGPVATARRRSPLRHPLLWAVGTIAFLFAATTAWFLLKPAPQRSVVLFTVPLPESARTTAPGFSLSPDGHTLVFSAPAAPGKPPILWVRPLDSPEAEPIPGTDDATSPFWSPDSQQIGFYANGAVEKVAASGGSVQMLCQGRGAGATWNRDGVILFTNHGKLYRIPQTGGTPRLVASPGAAYEFYRLPQFLPDGRHFFFMAGTWIPTGNQGTSDVALKIGSLDSGKTQNLIQGTSEALYARPGYLFFAEGGNLMARAFNARSLKFTGQAFTVARNLGIPVNRWAPFSVSQTGVLAYQQGGAGMLDQMVLFDRKGQKIRTIGEPGLYNDPTISPDGTRVAVKTGSSSGDVRTIWVYNLKRGTGSRLTFAPAHNTNPVWSPDGSDIYFTSYRNGMHGIYEKSANGLGSARPVFQSIPQNLLLDTLSPDGRYAIFLSQSSTNQEWALPLTGGQKPFVYLEGQPVAYQATFSPKGPYVAYASNETGRYEVYVQTFPQHLGKWQISTAGGSQPMWRSDGKEMFYISSDSEVMSVDVSTTSSEFRAGTPSPLFHQPLADFEMRNGYAVSPDGRRFLMLVPAAPASPESVTVVLNWPALLKK